MNNRNIILGINWGGHDTSAALMIDGTLIAACEEERYTGEKHTRVFPAQAVKDCLGIAEIDIKDVTMVSFAYKPKLLLEHQGPIRKMRRDLPTEEQFKETLYVCTGYKGDVEFHPHHLAHIASAYYPSGFRDSLLMSNDGVGERMCSMFASGEGGNIKVLHPGNPWPNSLGLVYSSVTFFLGWKPMYDEGIIMGLAPLGDSSKSIMVDGNETTFLEVFRDIIKVENDFDVIVNTDWVSFHEIRSKFVSDRFIETFGEKREWNDPLLDIHKNIAAALQDRLEEVVLQQLKTARQKFGFDKLCIAGGVGLNCSLNGKILANNIFDEIFVQPGSGDNGLSIGACYLSRKKHLGTMLPEKFHNFYLGHRDSDQEIEKYLEDNNIEYTRLHGDYSKVCEHLEDSKIIGWSQDAAEFGPRALGNRSILAKPAPKDIKDHVNARVKFREEFRPFAPAVLANKASEWFEIDQISPHMLMAVQARKDKAEEIAAVIHVDNSARVQTVDDLNPKFKKLIEQYEARTGYPILLNTSFNVKGQPIVNDVHDAYKCFINTNIDILVVGDYMITKENN